MKIVACIKRVPVTETQVKIAGDGKSLEKGDLQYMVSFYDELAVEQAIQTKEALGGEVTIMTIGSSGSNEDLRKQLARGADDGLIVEDEDWLDRDCRSTAKVLAKKLEAMGAGCAFFGRVATDRDNAAVGPMVATYLGWACVTEVIDIELTADGGTAKRETEHGVETVRFSLPAIITCNKGLNEPRRAGLKDIMAAKKKTIATEPVEAEANQAEVLEVALPPARKEGRIVGEGVDAVPALIEALQNEAQVL